MTQKSPFTFYQKQIDELKKRIEVLEQRPQFIPYIPTPYYPPQQQPWTQPNPNITPGYPYPFQPIATC